MKWYMRGAMAVVWGWSRLHWFRHRVPLEQLPGAFEVRLDPRPRRSVELFFDEATPGIAPTALHIRATVREKTVTSLDPCAGQLFVEAGEFGPPMPGKPRFRVVVHVDPRAHLRRRWEPDQASCVWLAKQLIGVENLAIQSPEQLLWWLYHRKEG